MLHIDANAIGRKCHKLSDFFFIKPSEKLSSSLSTFPLELSHNFCTYLKQKKTSYFVHNGNVL